MRQMCTSNWRLVISCNLPSNSHRHGAHDDQAGQRVDNGHKPVNTVMDRRKLSMVPNGEKAYICSRQPAKGMAWLWV